MSRAKKPTPEVKHPMLPSAGRADGRSTPHDYVTARPCELPGDFGGPAWEFIYKCTQTGVERRWGVEDRAVKDAGLN